MPLENSLGVFSVYDSSIKMSNFLQISVPLLVLLYFLKQGCNKEGSKKKLLFIESNSPANPT